MRPVEDYPVYRPEPDAGWEAADEVFLMDGIWWWRVSDEMQAELDLDPMESHGPAAGPDPVAIYTPWEADFRDRLAAREARAAELVQLRAA